MKKLNTAEELEQLQLVLVEIEKTNEQKMQDLLSRMDLILEKIKQRKCK